MNKFKYLTKIEWPQAQTLHITEMTETESKQTSTKQGNVENYLHNIRSIQHVALPIFRLQVSRVKTISLQSDDKLCELPSHTHTYT